jgi:hypothetical protein
MGIERLYNLLAAGEGGRCLKWVNLSYQGRARADFGASPQAHASQVFCELLGIYAFTRVICPPIPSPGFPRAPVATPGVAAVEEPCIALPISTKSCYKEPVF